ncbi:GDSL-type esterase/lipase family protein [Streptomyces sp. DH37]|uniref:GDSL-type esterase/lipase family protein n=1 Tax=Streptomyces sp. DH37 TaxID=3040122 RepID=UPI0024415FAE|nr:GDSL-type esterase/lipase family protein [Streptomyces sp. DH37]MDG9706437.1 cellulose binding domain-containing protein [Streptomyces sp. DH37]
MRSRHLLRAALTALALLLGILGPAGAGSAPASAAPAGAAAEPVRIMPLGDSITGSPGCWRSLLWNRLQEAGHTDVDFVGTLGPQGCGQPHDGDNEGHGGALVTEVASRNQLPAWLAATRPDIVVMHFGTNDVWSNRSPDAVLAAYGTLVDQMRASNPDMKVLVAQIIPMNPATCGECARRVVALNERIPAWARSKSTANSPVIAVDQWTGFDTASDTYDGVHPDASGDEKIAARWFPVLADLLARDEPGGPGEPDPGQGGAACTASFRATSVWQGGYQGEVTVRNTGTAPISGWTVRIAPDGGGRITQVWNGVLGTGSDGAATVRNAAWNGTVAAGGSASFGFVASSTPSSAAVGCTATAA